MISVLAQLILIIVHSPDGHVIQLNPSQIIAMRAAKSSPNKLITHQVKCAIHTVDGHFIGVVETCARVRDLIGQAGAG